MRPLIILASEKMGGGGGSAALPVSEAIPKITPMSNHQQGLEAGPISMGDKYALQQLRARLRTAQSSTIGFEPL